MSTTTPAAPAAPAIPLPVAPRFSPPGAPVKPVPTLKNKFLWIYGEPKIGKSTLASQLPGAWFVATEKGHDFLMRREPTLISTWADFKAFVQYLWTAKPKTFADGEPIEFIVIDVVDDLYRMCFNEVVKSLGVTDPGELPHGKGWSAIKSEVFKVFGALKTLPYGVAVISHCRAKEVTINNQKQARMEPNIGASAFAFLLGASDLIIYLHAEAYVDKSGPTPLVKSRRVMQCQPSQSVMAGGRMGDILPFKCEIGYATLMDYIAKNTPMSATNTVVGEQVVSASPTTEPQEPPEA